MGGAPEPGLGTHGKERELFRQRKKASIHQVYSLDSRAGAVKMKPEHYLSLFSVLLNAVVLMGQG